MTPAERSLLLAVAKEVSDQLYAPEILTLIAAVESEQSETGSPYIAPGELDALTNSKCCETCAFTPGPCVDEAPVFCGHRFGWKRGQRSGPLRTEPEQGRDIRRLPRLQRRGHEVLETSV